MCIQKACKNTCFTKVLQRNLTNWMYIKKEKEIYFKGLACTIVEIASLQGRLVGWKFQQVFVLLFELEGWKLRWNFYVEIWRQKSYVFTGPWSFLLKLSNDWMRLHIRETSLLYSKSTDLTLSHI